MKFNMKTGLTVTIVFAVILFGFLLVGSNQRAEADVSESGISLKLSFSEIMTLLKTYIGTEVEDPKLSGVTNYDSLTLSDDLIVGGNTSFTGTLSITGAVDTGIFTQGGDCLSMATSSRGTTTLTQLQLTTYDCFDLTSTVAQAYGLGLPASSSWTTLIPNVGDSRQWVIGNATSGAVTLEITVGTGVTLVADTTDDDIIDQLEFAKIDCLRRNATSTPSFNEIVCFTTESTPTD